MTISNRHRNVFHISHITVADTKGLSAIFDEQPSYKYTESEYEGSESVNSKIRVHRCDITDLAVDAIVCSTQTQLTLAPVGICETVWSKGGKGLQKACEDIGYCFAGDAFLTDGYDLPANCVLHTAGPSPDTKLNYMERNQCLRQSYLSCLQLVKNTPDIKSVAFPCLGTGGAGIELKDAIQTAVVTIRQWLEDVDNKLSVDLIVLCLYDENQWDQYIPELIKVFPYGKDYADLDLEQLDMVARSTLTLPAFVHATNILCYQYKQAACRTITKHFHQLVNTCRRRLGNPDTADTPVHRYKNCEMFDLCGRGNHQLTIYHSIEAWTLEIQIANFCPDSQTVDEDICGKVQNEIKDYFDRNIENITSYKTYTRCGTTSWGDTEGLWSIDRLLTLARHQEKKQKLCKHVCQKDTHIIDPNTMLKYWITQNSDSIESSESSGSQYNSSSRLPEEHPKSEPPQSSSPEKQPSPLFDPNVIQSQPKPRREAEEGIWPWSISPSHPPIKHSLLPTSDEELDSGIRSHHESSYGASWSPLSNIISNVLDKGLQMLTTSVKPGQVSDDRVCTTKYHFNDLSSMTNKDNSSNTQHEARNLRTMGAGESLDVGDMSSENMALSNVEETIPKQLYNSAQKEMFHGMKNKRTMDTCSLNPTNFRNAGLKDNACNSDSISLEDISVYKQNTCEEGVKGKEISKRDAMGPETLEAKTMVVRCDPSMDDDARHSVGQSDATHHRICLHCSRSDPSFDHSKNRKSGSFKSCRASDLGFVAESELLVFDDLGNRRRSESGTSSIINVGKSEERGSHAEIRDQDLLTVATHIGNKQFQLGIELGLSGAEVQMIMADRQANALMQGFDILYKWRCRNQAHFSQLFDAMEKWDIDTRSLREQFDKQRTKKTEFMLC